MSDGTDPNKIQIDISALICNNKQNNQNANLSNVEPMKLESLNEGTLILQNLQFTQDNDNKKK